MPDNANTTRLNKYLALQLGISRREADDYIASGRVIIDGQPASLGNVVNPESVISIDNIPLGSQTTYQYYALNKPTGYVCSRKRQGDTPTIYELIPKELHHLKPVGRLDKDSSGIILLTNDGDFAHTMTHPSFHKRKTYEVTLDHSLEPLHRQMISDHGIQLDDGTSKFEIERMRDGDDLHWKITMTEGRNRQIRRTFAALGYDVKKLHRTEFGVYKLEDLESGEYKEFEL